MAKFNEYCDFEECEEHSEEWHKLRQRAIGGSDAGTVLGLNQYKTVVDLWKEKISKELPENINNPAMEFGSKSEEHIRSIWSLKNLKNVIKINGTLISRDYPFMAVNLDGYIQEDNGLMEIKTTTIQNSSMLDKWKDGNIPDQYFTQCLHALAVTGADYIILFALLYFAAPFNNRVAEFREYKFIRSEVQEQIDYLIEEEGKFWDLVKKKEMPKLKIIF